MSFHPVVIKHDKSVDTDLDHKRFHLPGFTLETSCPSEDCGANFSRDYGDHYLAHPTANSPFLETLYCEDCGHEWDVTLNLSLSLEVVK